MSSSVCRLAAILFVLCALVDGSRPPPPRRTSSKAGKKPARNAPVVEEPLNEAYSRRLRNAYIQLRDNGRMPAFRNDQETGKMWSSNLGDYNKIKEIPKIVEEPSESDVEEPPPQDDERPEIYVATLGEWPVVLKCTRIYDWKITIPLINEIQVLSNLVNATRVVTFYHAFMHTVIDGDGSTEAFLCMVMEYLNGSDLHILTKEQLVDADHPVDEESWRKRLRDVAIGLREVWTTGYIHRDVKLPNAVSHTTKNGRKITKLIDFGTAIINPGDGRMIHEYCGTPQFIAPELLADPKHPIHDRSMDIFGFGVMCHTALTRHYPCEQDWTEDEITASERAECFKEMKYDIANLLHLRSAKNVSVTAKELIARLLTYEHSERFGMKDNEIIENAAWFVNPIIPPRIVPGPVRRRSRQQLQKK